MKKERTKRMDWVKGLAYKGQIRNNIKRGIEDKLKGEVEIKEHKGGWSVCLRRNGRPIYQNYYAGIPQYIEDGRIDKNDCDNLVNDFINHYVEMISSDFFKKPVDISFHS